MCKMYLTQLNYLHRTIIGPIHDVIRADGIQTVFGILVPHSQQLDVTVMHCDTKLLVGILDIVDVIFCVRNVRLMYMSTIIYHI